MSSTKATSPPTPSSLMPLAKSAAADLLSKAAPEQQPALSDWQLSTIDTLKERCAQFGVDATTSEIFAAGLQLLLNQTDTALEVALLQSLRSDRSFVQRKVRRRPVPPSELAQKSR